jgi:hypothetical protein
LELVRDLGEFAFEHRTISLEPMSEIIWKVTNQIPINLHSKFQPNPACFTPHLRKPKQQRVPYG